MEIWSAPTERSGGGALDSCSGKSKAVSRSACHRTPKNTLGNLRPYFYDNKAWVEGDAASLNEVKAMAELILNNFASAIIHSAVFPEYPVRGVERRSGFICVTAPPCGISLWKARPIPACQSDPNLPEERNQG
jgi:hypothetical protein